MIKTGKELAAAVKKIATSYKTLYVMGCFGAPLKAEYKERAAGNTSAGSKTSDEKVDAALIVGALGGKENILKVTNCYTRLRTELENTDLVDENVLKNQTGAAAVIKKGKNVQVVYGLKVTAVRKAVDQELGITEQE